MKGLVIFLCVVVLPLLLIAVGTIISARQAAAADRREESEIDYSDDYPVRP